MKELSYKAIALAMKDLLGFENWKTMAKATK